MNCLVWVDNSFVIRISDNLDYARRCLQHKTEVRFLWVDFICINQDDLEERKAQVQLMYQIYSRSAKVVVFLGKEADGSQCVPSILSKISDAHFKNARRR